MYSTHVGTSSTDAITIYGHDLCNELIGKASLTDLIFLGAQNRLPQESESKMLNALMLGVAEHGFTPSSLAARLTWLGAPEATQAAVAAGLLGAGSVYLGAMELTTKMLADGFAAHPEASLEEIATAIADKYEETGERLPGFGHPVHRPVDPRTVRWYELAEQWGVLGQYGRLLTAVHAEVEKRRGKPITLNGAGTFGGLLGDLGFGWQTVRTIVTAARAVGLVGHIAEEASRGTRDSTAQQLYMHVQDNTDYQA
ncbi:citrate synthase [Antricoccus suffuscus]|uniref:citrate synthase (unknown stereospecificity) n=1 Tax=Antricoccus suffuscus TaxID=1629062 RepID=A0A2T1A291_9ACTN|nr:citryl-CoA lyase [Antricoccus suffuscus]PRZ42731.1 citrate synthase [Antricoccus suffuscus]